MILLEIKKFYLNFLNRIHLEFFLAFSCFRMSKMRMRRTKRLIMRVILPIIVFLRPKNKRLTPELSLKFQLYIYNPA